METRNCQNCKNDFTIEPDDFAFYQKIQVPPPTFCPECRLIRRMCWRNHRSFYRRSCEICSKSLLSVYKEDNAPVMCAECWMGDGWDHFRNGKDINWEQPILTQVNDLLKVQPRVFQYKLGGVVINSDYSNSVANSKNIYLSFSLVNSENISFSENIDNSKDSQDCLYCTNINRCSWNIDSIDNYNCHFVVDSNKNIDSLFLFDCSNCQNCCLSSNLRNKSYVFKNKQLTKEEYEKELKDLSLNSFSGFESTKKEFLLMKSISIVKYAKNLNSVNVTGDHINNSKDVSLSFDIGKSENISNTFRVIECKDLKDCCWVLRGELEYETISGSENASSQIGCIVCYNSVRTEYSLFCRGCSDCFACVGLKNAKYCILNKQYTKEEYEELVPKLKQYMINNPYIDLKGRVYTYGEFFPYEMCPFGYNETMAHDYFPKTKEELIALGFNWKEPEIRKYEITKNYDSLPDKIEDVEDSILKDVVECPNKGNYMFQCTTAFKITPEELLFDRQNNLPLPRYCPNCRHYQRLNYRNQPKLYIRSCMCDLSDHDHQGKCQNEFETPYKPSNPDLIYCEKCYQKEVL